MSKKANRRKQSIIEGLVMSSNKTPSYEITSSHADPLPLVKT